MKQKVTPFLSVLLALSFLMPAALFAKPIEARAAQFYSTPTKVLVSNNLRYKSSTKSWTFGSNDNNPIGVDDITWGDQANCAMITTIAFRSTIHKPVSAGDTLNVEANVSLYDYDNAGYTMYFCIFNEDGKQLIEPRKMNKSGTNKYSIAAKINNDVDGYFGFISGKLTCNKASESSHVFTAKIANWTVQCEPGEVGFWNAVKEALTNVLTWLKEIRDKIVNGFNDLGKTISNQFSNLVKNVQSMIDSVNKWLSDTLDNIKQFMSNVGKWFTNLGNSISGFFEKLWNRIWWGNENGESEYVKPTISNKLLDILATLQDYQEKLKATIDTIGSAATDVANYISAGTSFVNGVVGVAGAGFTALIVFGIVFVLVRKVVGR